MAKKSKKEEEDSASHEVSELEKEVEEEIESENLQEQLDELPEDSDTQRFQEFLQSTGGVNPETEIPETTGFLPAPVLEQTAPAQPVNLEQDIIDTLISEEQSKEQKDYVTQSNESEINYTSTEPENIETTRPVPALMPDINTGVMPLTREQRFAIETEADKLRNREQERGEYITDIKNVEIERHLPFEDPKRRYKERPIR